MGFPGRKGSSAQLRISSLALDWGVTDHTTHLCFLQILPGTGTQKLLIICQRTKDSPTISCAICHFWKGHFKEESGAGTPVLVKLFIRE